MTFARPGRWSTSRPDAGVLPRGEDQVFGDEALRPILPDVVRPEMGAFARIVDLRRSWESGDADRVRLFAVVEHPDVLDTVFHVVEHRLVEDDEQIAPG